MRAGYCNRPPDRCKGRFDSRTENSPDAPATRRPGPLAPHDRDRRVAELREALAGTAPTSQARIDAGGPGGAAMNRPTTRGTTPAADPRTGRGAFVLPRDPGLDRLLADPDLGSTAKTIAIALVKHWAWFKDSCWPCDRTIAGKVGKSQGHVQRCLRQLEDAGWIERERTDEVRTGRRIWLAWRRPTAGAGAQGGPAPAREGLAAPARDKRIVVVKEGIERKEIASPERQRPEPISPVPPATPVPQPEPTVAPDPVEV
ncbi:MAG TPA: helix-turn-helix domain-containing protein, partial [Isosphaeraceae bacterium]|nr:helix-turn-helix domain-containing protein [Isosphaeraceae bacterium]